MRRIALAGIIAAVLVGVYLAVGSGAKPYVVKLSLADADGLREGSPVSIAGQDVGSIAMTVHEGHVVVTAKINAKDGPVGRNATASIDSVNLLGQKRMLITKGNLKDPAPSGYTLPASQVGVSTDLDQVLDVLTPDVRARLGILIDESGAAVAGRRADISQVLEELPTDFGDLNATVTAVADNNHTLGNLVDTTNGFVQQLASQNTALENAIDSAGQTAATVAGRRAALAATLSHAPATLTSLDGFLGKLKSATVPLGPAAQDISSTAPELNAALKQVDPFRQAADPALTRATQVAPELTSLATGATPVLRQAAPVLGDLSNFSENLTPISGILNKSTDNLLSILQNWSRAIEFRDGLSHVFRGEASVTPQTVETLINTLSTNPVAGSALARLEAGLTASTGRASDKPTSGTAGSNLGSALSGLLGGLTRGGSKSRTSGRTSGSAPAGSPTPASPSSTSTTPSSTSTTSSSSNSLSSLLGYLLG